MTDTTALPTISVVILAAGAGTRMNSALPKPMHQVAGIPMVEHVITTARALDPVDITIVVSPFIEEHLVKDEWGSDIRFVVQDPPQGTGDAVRVALQAGAAGESVLVLYADSPLVTADVLSALAQRLSRPGVLLAVMTCHVDDIGKYGRIARDSAARMEAIVEEKADKPELRIDAHEINSGYMALNRTWATAALDVLPKNPIGKEYFLTDLVAMAYAQDPWSVDTVSGSQDLLLGINDRTQLAAAEAMLYERKRKKLLEEGVSLIAPSTNLIFPDVEVGKDTVIGPGCIIEAGSRIGGGCRIGPYAIIRRSDIGDRVRIESSTIEDTTIGPDSDVGPYSHLRGGTEIGANVHIGNFAEVKNARIGDRTRVGHFSYLGDAGLGQDVNIGAGTVTCNFDGVDKHRTEIDSGAFIGSDSMLIAPVSVGAGARTGAGSVVTKDVGPGATVVGMPARQIRRAATGKSATDGGEG